MRRGFQEVAKWKQINDERDRLREIGYVPNFVVEDGEEVEGLWFNGTSDEPGILEIHTKAFSPKKFRSIIHREKECLGCYLHKTGDKSVSHVQEKGVFLVADPRRIHKVLDEENSNKDRQRFKYIKCTGDVDSEDPKDNGCDLCASGKKTEPAGQKRWELSMTWVAAIMARNEKLRGTCTCGGKIRRILKPSGIEEVTCGKCSKPNPLSMFMVPFTVSRTGSKKQTTYSINSGRYEPMPDWVSDMNPPALEDLYPQPTIEQQCKIFECDNPFEAFSPKKASSSYDDDEESVDSIF